MWERFWFPFFLPMLRCLPVCFGFLLWLTSRTLVLRRLQSKPAIVNEEKIDLVRLLTSLRLIPVERGDDFAHAAALER